MNKVVNTQELCSTKHNLSSRNCSTAMFVEMLRSSGKSEVLHKLMARCGALLVVFAVALVGLSACKVPGMHRPSLQQGNLITQSMVDKLKPGMSKEQVEFVLGLPVHLNTFNVNQWDYIYTFENRLGERTRRVLTLKFENDQLVYMAGHFKPSSIEDEDENQQDDATADDPATSDLE